MEQGKLFDVTAGGRSAQPSPQARPEIRPHFADPEDTERLTGHNDLILAALRQGPMLNKDIRKITNGLNHTPRITDVRQWLMVNEDRDIHCRHIAGCPGLCEYSIVPWTGEHKHPSGKD